MALCPLRSDTTIGPSSEYGSLFLLIPLIPLQTSIMVSLVGPREPVDFRQRGFNVKTCAVNLGLAGKLLMGINIARDVLHRVIK